MAYREGSEKLTATAVVNTTQDSLTDSPPHGAMPSGRISLDSDAALPQQDSTAGFWHELLSELMYLEATTAYWALQAANPADVKMQELNQILQSDTRILRSGQRADNQYLTCIECSHHYYVNGVEVLTPCDCGCRLFIVGRQH